MLKLAALVFLLVVVWALFGSLERRMLYYPDLTFIATPAVFRLPFEDVSLRTDDGIALHGWFVPASSGHARTILFCHGNAGNISHRLDKIKRFHDMGVATLFFDYRGYGHSQGRPTEAGTYADAEAAYGFLVQKRKIPPAQIVLYGESLGCAVAIELARRHPEVAGIILESPFTSTLAMARRAFPRLPVRWLIRDPYDNLAKAAKLRPPALVLHSPQDEIVPYAMGRQLFEALPGRKTFVNLAGGHNDGYESAGESYTNSVRSFLLGL